MLSDYISNKLSNKKQYRSKVLKFNMNATTNLLQRVQSNSFMHNKVRDTGIYTTYVEHSLRQPYALHENDCTSHFHILFVLRYNKSIFNFTVRTTMTYGANNWIINRKKSIKIRRRKLSIGDGAIDPEEIEFPTRNKKEYVDRRCAVTHVIWYSRVRTVPPNRWINRVEISPE